MWQLTLKLTSNVHTMPFLVNVYQFDYWIEFNVHLDSLKISGPYIF